MATNGAEGCISRTCRRGTTALLPAMVMIGLIAVSPGLRAQRPAKVDFGRDVQPIFKTYCIGCHGPTQQMNGFRLDRRRDAMRGGTIAVVGPGNSAGSRLYQRLVGDQYGLRMPPTGPLSEDKISIIKAWIDQGANWPDELSGETPPPPADPGATALMNAMRRGDSAAFQKNLNDDPKAANRKGPGGSTPLMYAALYGDSDSLRRLLTAGADPNLKNDAGATALMWAAGDLEKTRLLVDHGADVNARSDNGRTPLMIVATRHGSTPILQLLLDHGANPSAQSPGLFGVMTALSEAAYASDGTAMHTLIARGADVKGAGVNLLTYALMVNCVSCVNLVIGSTSKPDLNLAMLFDTPPLGDTSLVKPLLDRGADLNTKDPDGNTLLMMVCAADTAPLDLVKFLIDRGADVNARSPHGETALELAMRHGHTPVVDLLMRAGAKPSEGPAEASAEAPADGVEIKTALAHTAREAVDRSLPLLQRSDVEFRQKSGCVSCHNNTLTATTVATARRRGIGVDEQIATQQLKATATYLEGWRDRALQGVGIPGDTDSMGAILLGMADANYPPDPATDAMALFLKDHQSPDGRWYSTAYRPPLESSDVQTTATTLHAVQVYAPQAQRADYDRAVQHAAAWLSRAQLRTTEDRAYQLLGLAWASTDRKIIKQAAAGLLAEQRPDGGWAQLPSLASDAFATGQALVALAQSGALAVADAAYQRGAQYLMGTQLADGSWYVKRRALPIQPYFESGFPHGRDQFISAAATNWATMALALATRTSTSALAKTVELR
jgi:ankyrin repeat protein